MDIPSLPPLPHPVLELVTLRTRGFTYYNTSICTCSCCCRCCCYQGWDVATFLTGCWSVRRIACITCISEMQNAKTGFISSYVPALFFSLYYLCVSSIYLSAGLPRCPGSKVAATSQVNPSTDVMLYYFIHFHFRHSNPDTPFSACASKLGPCLPRSPTLHNLQPATAATAIRHPPTFLFPFSPLRPCDFLHLVLLWPRTATCDLRPATCYPRLLQLRR